MSASKFAFKISAWNMLYFDIIAVKQLMSAAVTNFHFKSLQITIKCPPFSDRWIIAVSLPSVEHFVLIV